MAITASVNYHIKSDLPQAFEFDVDGVCGKLISPELVSHQVHVKDVRDGYTVHFDSDGVVFAKAPTNVASFVDELDWQNQYESELQALLKEHISAAEVIVFDHTVRVDDSDAVRKPARNVHNDYSRAGAEQRLIDIVGKARARAFRAGRFGFVNVWRPVKQPIRSSPLGFIRPKSMHPNDWMNIELIYPDRRGQILGVAANLEHEWFYQSEMTPDEVVVFNIYDNGGRPHLAHSALDLPEDDHTYSPRMSIESRTLVRYH